jgi:hypothetical protein
MGRVLLELGPLPVLAGVLQRERMQLEVALEAGELLVGGLHHVDPPQRAALVVGDFRDHT